jgi:hypothetical protein
MRTTELFLDLTHPDTVHASLTCERNHGLAEAAEHQLGEPPADVDQTLAALAELGIVVPAWSARGLKYCPHCTLVATTEWAVAA